MNEKLLNRVTIIGTAFLGLAFLTWWLLYNPVRDFAENLPGMDNRPPDFVSASEAVEIGAYFESFEGIPSTIYGSWPRFRGAGFDNISKENLELIDQWDDSVPNILWSIDLGEGHAGPVVSNGRVYLLDYDEEKRADVLRCFSFDDGKEIETQMVLGCDGMRSIVAKKTGLCKKHEKICVCIMQEQPMTKKQLDHYFTDKRITQACDLMRDVLIKYLKMQSNIVKQYNKRR